MTIIFLHLRASSIWWVIIKAVSRSIWTNRSVSSTGLTPSWDREQLCLLYIQDASRAAINRLRAWRVHQIRILPLYRHASLNHNLTNPFKLVFVLSKVLMRNCFRFFSNTLCNQRFFGHRHTRGAAPSLGSWKTLDRYLARFSDLSWKASSPPLISTRPLVRARWFQTCWKGLTYQHHCPKNGDKVMCSWISKETLSKMTFSSFNHCSPIQAFFILQLLSFAEFDLSAVSL